MTPAMTPAVTGTKDDAPLLRRLPERDEGAAPVDPDALLTSFLDHVADAGLTLYPAQEEALLELAAGKNVILNTPTGSGKSLVATAAAFFTMARGERTFYTCPIKALVSEKFFALCRDFGPDNVGMMTGDATVNHDAPIVCCTAEILANIALREGRDAPVDMVVMDEFHYYADRDRGVAWQLPLLILERARFLLMSATMGNTEPFERCLTKLTGAETALVRSTERPVPLDFDYRETPLHETVQDVVAKGKYPIYIVNFTQRACAEEAQNLMSVDFCTKQEKKAIADALAGARFDSPYGKEIQKFVRHGIGIHHAGLLPKYRLIVEKLAQKGHLKIICGTDTLGVGVNIPIRTVLFTKLCKFDGEKTAILSVRDFQQIAGRAGRKGFDEQGSVIAQAPEHVIENLRMEAKAGNDPAKRRKLVKKKPPEKGYVHWDKATFERLVASAPEALTSRFQVTHGMLLNVLAREAGGCMAMARLIRKSHERPHDKRVHGRTALAMYKSLLDHGIVEIVPRVDDWGYEVGKKLVVNADLQEDFSLNQALSLFLVDTIPRLDPDSETYALDLLSLCESILENPEIVLMKQLDKLKTEKLAELKAAGVEYDERIAELEKLEYPKPNKDFIYDTFNAFAAKHPWVGDNIRPKSVAREMVENFYSFADYVKEYDLQRSEGLVLRYLSDVYKVLVQTVPDGMKTPEFDEIVTFFGAIVRQVDSSLLDEWERLRAPRLTPELREETQWEPEGSKDITADKRAFTVLVRNELFHVVRALAARDYAAAAKLFEAGTLEGENAPTEATFERALAPFWDEHTSIRTDADARAPKWIRIEHLDDRWEVEQMLLDDAEANDWVVQCVVDLERARVLGRPVLRYRRVGMF
jgi:superfamily II RNA helicase